MTSIDYLIVGQGLAGTLLAHYLLKENCTIKIIDPHFAGSASKVAAGIINPITGRRVVKSWKIDTLIPFAKQCYQEIEAKLGITIFQECNILRVLKNVKDENLWFSKTAYYDLAAYLVEEPETGAYAEQLKAVFSFGEIKQSAQVDVKLLMETYRNYFLAADLLVSARFDHNQLVQKANTIQYQGWEAKKVIFCEGHQARFNPYFDFIPFEAAKGEMLIVHIPNSNFEKILKHGVFIVPLKNKDHYWIGATYEWEFEDDATTQTAKEELLERLEKVLKLPFEVVAHYAAVRPTVKDRRPFVGLHPRLPHLGFFNGLGTKGTSLSPFWAKQFVDFLIHNIALPEVVGLERCYSDTVEEDKL
ncbi:MAG: NAD(P)/FAD-dependent oxidoreductase [Saprospiraceae bacterium]